MKRQRIKRLPEPVAALPPEIKTVGLLFTRAAQPEGRNLDPLSLAALVQTGAEMMGRDPRLATAENIEKLADVIAQRGETLVQNLAAANLLQAGIKEEPNASFTHQELLARQKRALDACQRLVLNEEIDLAVRCKIIRGLSDGARAGSAPFVLDILQTALQSREQDLSATAAGGIGQLGERHCRMLGMAALGILNAFKSTIENRKDRDSLQCFCVTKSIGQIDKKLKHEILSQRNALINLLTRPNL